MSFCFGTQLFCVLTRAAFNDEKRSVGRIVLAHALMRVVLRVRFALHVIWTRGLQAVQLFYNS